MNQQDLTKLSAEELIVLLIAENEKSEKLEIDLKSAANDLTAMGNQLEDLQKQSTADAESKATQIGELQKLLDDKTSELENTVELNKEFSAEVDRLDAALKAAEQPAPVTAGSKATFIVDEVEHEIVFPKMSRKGDDGVMVVITAEDVLASEKLQKDLVASGSGMIRVKQ